MDIVKHNGEKTGEALRQGISAGESNEASKQDINRPFLGMDFQLSETTFEAGESSLDSEGAKTSQRIHYEAQVEVIKRQIGGLESARLKLGLSARKMCQLLLVDPSAWTRWRKDQDPPPHIWRALQWYLALQEKIPGLTPQYFVGKDPETLHASTLKRVQLMEQDLHRQNQFLHDKNQELEGKVKNLETAVRANRITAVMMGLATLIMAFAFYHMIQR